MTPRELLLDLASAGHSRHSAHRASGISWNKFRALCAEHPDIQWRKPGDHLRGLATKRALARKANPPKDPLLDAIRVFSGEEHPQLCRHKHKRHETGVFFCSVRLIQCATCKGWQKMEAPIV